jgi:hypothetical protein
MGYLGKMGESFDALTHPNPTTSHLSKDLSREAIGKMGKAPNEAIGKTGTAPNEANGPRAKRSRFSRPVV